MSCITSSLDTILIYFIPTLEILRPFSSVYTVHSCNPQAKTTVQVLVTYSPYFFRMLFPTVLLLFSSPTHSTTSHETLVPGLHKLLHSLHLTVHCLTEPWLSREHTTCVEALEGRYLFSTPVFHRKQCERFPKSLVPLIGSNSTTSSMRHMTSGYVTLLFSGCFNIMQIT